MSIENNYNKLLLLYPACLLGGFVANEPAALISHYISKIFSKIFLIEYKNENLQEIRDWDRLVAKFSKQGFDQYVGMKCWKSGTSIPIREEIVYRCFFWKIIAPTIFFNTSKSTKILASSLYFATAHLNNNRRTTYLTRQWVFAFILGTAISLLIKKTGLIGAILIHAGVDLYAAKFNFNLSFKEMFKAMNAISLRDNLTANKIMLFARSCLNEAIHLCILPAQIPFRLAKLCDHNDANRITTYLNFKNNKLLTNQDLQLLFRASPHLKRLDLSGCDQITDISNLPQSLTFLNLSECINLKNEDLHHLPAGLLDLHLTDCSQLTDDAFISMPKNLKILKLGGCVKLSDAALMKLTDLEFINAVGCANLKGEFLKNLTNLQELMLVDCPNFDTDFFRHSSKTLNVLTFGTSYLTSHKTIDLSETSISQLKLVYCDLNDESIKSLPTNLKKLHLMGCTTPSEGLKRLPASLEEYKIYQQ